MIEVISSIMCDGCVYEEGETITVETLDGEEFTGTIDDITEDQLTLIDDDGFTTIDIDNIDKILD